MIERLGKFIGVEQKESNQKNREDTYDKFNQFIAENWIESNNLKL